MPAWALNGKTPYEMGHKKEPYPGGIQEFGAATYVKDLAAGKLNAQPRRATLQDTIWNPRATRSIGLKSNP